METAPYQPHSRSSRSAAKRVAPYLKTIRYRVYCFIMNNAGTTDDEIREHLDLNVNTARPRRIELERAGLVVWTGDVRKGNLGATAKTWRVTDKPYPEKWDERSHVAETESGEARMRRNLHRAFPKRSVKVEGILDEIIERAAQGKEFGDLALMLRRQITSKDLMMVLRFIMAV